MMSTGTRLVIGHEFPNLYEVPLLDLVHVSR